MHARRGIMIYVLLLPFAPFPSPSPLRVFFDGEHARTRRTPVHHSVADEYSALSRPPSYGSLLEQPRVPLDYAPLPPNGIIIRDISRSGAIGIGHEKRTTLVSLLSLASGRVDSGNFPAKPFRQE